MKIISFKATALNLALLLTSIIVFFGGIEILLRVTGIETLHPVPPFIYRSNPNPEISYELKPNLKNAYQFKGYVSTDAHGFRSPPLMPGKPLLVTLGDSVTFGYGVNDDQTIGARLHDHFPAYDVLNAGVPGYNLTQEVETYRTKIAALQPNLVLLIYFPEDFGRTISWMDKDGFMRAPGWKPGTQTCAPITQGILNLVPGKCWLDLHSAFYKAVKDTVNRRLMRQIQSSDESKSFATIYDDSVTDQQWNDFTKDFERLQGSLAPDTKRLFILWPDRDIHYPTRQKLTRFLADNHWAFLDLYDFFGNRMETLPWDSVHPSPASIDEAVGIIADTLRHEGLATSHP